MFTGIIEELGTIKSIEKDKTNLVFTIESGIAEELKLNESVSHNGACLSVKPVSNKLYCVTAVKETLDRTNLKHLKKGDKVNLERSMKANGRIDGHFVLGHVDGAAECIAIKNLKGSHEFTFAIAKQNRKYIVEKGSIAINGVSLTVASLSKKKFSVAIIPYTFEHTNFKALKKGDKVNIEYDVLGKYVLGTKN
jgi:riboflavin synthase